ncbi:NAD-dependent histone deacetylase sir2 [Mortierella alpina]|nr:NAD-dependent histone deacetylase sir2 [Mortierella alpina]
MSLPPNSTAAALSASTPDDVVEDMATLHVPAELQAAKSRPESPVNRKRADDDDSSSSQGHQHLDGSKDHSNSLPPSKKSKTSPPLPASPSLSANADTDASAGGIIPTNFSSSSSSNLTDYRTSQEIAEDALSPQTSPILEPAMPTPALATIAMAYSGEKRYSPVSGDPVQSKARKLDEDDRRPSSPPFRPLSPRFQLQRQQEQQQQKQQQQQSSTIPAFDRSATAILDSLSKPGENSLGNLNLGTSTTGRTSVGERAMGVITSRPGSRQTSPGPAVMSHLNSGSVSVDDAKTVATTAKTHSAASNTHAEAMTQRLEGLQQTLSDKRMREPSPAVVMVTSSDDEHHHTPGELIGDKTHPEGIAEVDSEGEEGEDEEEEDGHHQVTEMAGVEESHAFGSDSEGEYDQDLMDEIDVENIGMLESDSDSEGSPYHDPDPMCIDRLTDDETDLILDEARMHGVGYIVRKYVLSGLISAKKMLLMTIPGQIQIPASLTENDIIRTFSERLRGVLRRRKRLQNVHSIDDVVELLKTSKRIMVLTGAGVSVSCGIPDFRSEDGIYSRLSEFELDDPQQMFDLEFFRERPEIFYSFAREIFPSNFIPSPSHYFIRLLEEQGSLLRNYTQNIDTLEQKAGIQKVLQCHGSFATASCVRCGHQVQGDDIKDSIFKQEVAYCKVCRTPTPPPRAKPQKKAKARYSSSDEDESDDDDDDNDPNRALMKPDIVFFGEKLPPLFDQSLKEDREKVDLLIVIGSSLKVAPVSDIMHQLPNSVPQILINRTPNYHMEFDVQLLGNCDTIVAELCRMAGWELRHEKLLGGTSNVPNMDGNTNKDGSGTGGRAAWSLLARGYYVFEGADVSERDVMALKAREARRAEEGAAHPSLGFGDNFDTDDDDEEDDDEDEDEDDSKEVGDMEGLTSDISSRRPPHRDERDASTGLMDVEEEHEAEEGSSDDDDDTQQNSDPASFGMKPPSVAHAGAGTATAAQGSTLISPRLHPIGFATGTTVPRSGSITDIHHDVISAALRSADAAESASLSSHSGSLRSPKFSSASVPASEPSRAFRLGTSDDFDDDEEEVKIRVMFTEKMPKDLGEEDNGDGEVGLGLHGRGHVLLGHGRQPSVDLEPITEDKQLEVEESSVSMTLGVADEDEEIEVGGPEGPPPMAPDTSSVAGHGEHA